MHLRKDYISSYNNSQVAYPVSENRDSYNINSWYNQNLLTGEITVIHKLYKNDVYGDKHPNTNYKPNTKFREFIAEGTYLELSKMVEAIILEQGEFRRVNKDKPFEEILVFTLE